MTYIFTLQNWFQISYVISSGSMVWGCALAEVLRIHRRTAANSHSSGRAWKLSSMKGCIMTPMAPPLGVGFHDIRTVIAGELGPLGE